MWKRRAAWLLILAAALCMYAFHNNAATRTLPAAAVILPLCSALALFLPRRSPAVRLSVPETITRGEPAFCNLTLENRSAFPLLSVRCTVEIHNLLTGEADRLTIAAAASGKRTVSTGFSLISTHCGMLEVQLSEVQLRDAFGLFVRRVPCGERRTAMVPPVLRPMELSIADTADFLLDSARYSTQKPGYDPSETFRIREYVPGDPIRQIHWKLSEKTDTTLVRDFGLPVVHEMLLLLETTALQNTVLGAGEADTLLDLLFSLSRALLSLDIPHAVGWQDGAAGVYEEREIQSGEDWAELQRLVLSNPLKCGEMTVAGCYGRSHLRCAYAHAAVLSSYLPPDLSLLCHGNRVTALLLCENAPEPADWRSDARSIPFTAGALEQGGLHLEL